MLINDSDSPVDNGDDNPLYDESPQFSRFSEGDSDSAAVDEAGDAMANSADSSIHFSSTQVSGQGLGNGKRIRISSPVIENPKQDSNLK